MNEAPDADRPLVDGRGCTVEAIFSGRPFRLDPFQREYVWRKNEVQALIGDLTDCFKTEWSPEHSPEQALRYSSYFLGPFVSYERSGHRFLADGQQRFVTLVLLLLHLRHLAKQQEQRDTVFTLEHLIAKPAAVGGHVFAMDHEDYKLYFDSIWSDRSYTSDGQHTYIQRMQEAYEEIASGLAARSLEDALPEFVAWLAHRVSLVEIKAVDSRTAWNIFQSMNSRGIHLSPLDFLKGYLVNEAGSKRVQAEAAWERMYRSLERIKEKTAFDFVTAVFRAKYSDIEPVPDAPAMATATHEWVRLHESKIWPSRKAVDRAEFVISVLAPLSGTYRRLLKAANTFDPELPAAYFNSLHGLETQFELAIACCQPGDTEKLRLTKVRAITEFVDLIFVLYGVNNDVLNNAELRASSVRLLPQLCKAAGIADVQNVLATELAELGLNVGGVAELRLRTDNAQFIRYMLARMTAWVDAGAQCGDHIAQYLAREEGVPIYEIEHMYPKVNLPHDEMAEADYKFQRSRIGALLLLDGSKNAGLGGLPLQQKLDPYRTPPTNILAASLSPAQYERGNAKFRKFARQEGLHTLFKPLPPNHSMQAFVDDRCNLYRAVAERVWDPVRLGLAPSEPIPASKTKPRTRRSYGVGFGELVRANLVSAGDVLVGNHRGKAYSAIVLSDLSCSDLAILGLQGVVDVGVCLRLGVDVVTNAACRRG